MSKRREFPKKVKETAWDRANGHCETCGFKLIIGKYHFDHVLPDAFGGEPTLENCAVLCVACHKEKTSKTDVPAIAKSNRLRARHFGFEAKSKHPLSFGKNSTLKRKVNGQIVNRETGERIR